jgi:hypothetical protein
MEIYENQENSFEQTNTVHWRIPGPEGLHLNDFAIVAPGKKEDDELEVEEDRDVQIFEIDPGRTRFDMTNFTIIKILRGKLCLLAEMYDEEDPLAILTTGECLEFSEVDSPTTNVLVAEYEMIIGTKVRCVIELRKQPN